MPECSISYIPVRLKRNNRPIIETFEVGEHLYMRCNPTDLENPYKNISITELSHNRAGLQADILCNPDDVLFSIKTEELVEKYTDKVVCTLRVISLNEGNKYKKVYKQTKKDTGTNQDIEYTGVIELIHEPEPCMYPHCVFRVWVNDEKITYDNHKHTLSKLHEIRAHIKEELASMIISRQVSQTGSPSYSSV